jgi:protein-disulfide isomerase
MSKKEEQRKIREEKQAAAQRREKRNALLVKGALVILVPLVLFVFYQGLFSGPPALPPDLVGDADHVRGNADAPVTLTMYADFQCPACQTEFQVIARAWPRIRDDVRLVYRYFPLDTHRFSYQAARYAEAAGRQDRFWEMHDMLFVNQQAWSGVEDPTLLIEDYAEQIGLDMAQLRADVELSEVRAKIISDQQGGVRAGVRSTPALFINGDMVPNPQTSGALITLIEAARPSG